MDTSEEESEEEGDVSTSSDDAEEAEEWTGFGDDAEAEDDETEEGRVERPVAGMTSLK